MSAHDVTWRPRRPPTCPSDFALERWRLGERGSGPDPGAHVEGCERCRERVARLAAAEKPPLDPRAIWARRPVVARPRAPLRRWLALALVPAVAAAVFVLVPRSPSGTPPAPEPGERNKGGAWWLGVIVRHPDGAVERVAPHGPVSPGDHLRFEVFGRGAAGHLAIISVDQRGVVTAFAPSSGTTVPVPAGRKQLLEAAVTLDDVLGPERLLSVACPRPRAIADILDAARAALKRAGGDLARLGDMGLGCDQDTFWIRKVARP